MGRNNSSHQSYTSSHNYTKLKIEELVEVYRRIIEMNEVTNKMFI